MLLKVVCKSQIKGLTTCRSITTIQRQGKYKKIKPNINFHIEESYFYTLRFPGVHALHFKPKQIGNYLTPATADLITQELKKYESNEVVGVVVLSIIEQEGIFSYGLPPGLYDTDRKACLDAVDQIKDAIKSYNSGGNTKNLISCYNGRMTGTGFAAFAGANYRLGTENTTMAINELQYGMLPTGGLAYYLVHHCDHGLEIARYLACSGETLNASDMYELGLMTHVTSQYFYEYLGSHFNGQVSEGTSMIPQAVQSFPGDITMLPELLDQHHIGSTLDPSSSPIWEKLDYDYGPEEDQDNVDMVPFMTSRYESIVKKAFKFKTGEETLQYIKDTVINKGKGKKNRYLNAQRHMNRLDNILINKWYDLTAEVKNMTLNESLAVERKYILDLQSSKIYIKQSNVWSRDETNKGKSLKQSMSIDQDEDDDDDDDDSSSSDEDDDDDDDDDSSSDEEEDEDEDDDDKKDDKKPMNRSTKKDKSKSTDTSTSEESNANKETESEAEKDNKKNKKDSKW